MAEETPRAGPSNVEQDSSSANFMVSPNVKTQKKLMAAPQINKTVNPPAKTGQTNKKIDVNAQFKSPVINKNSFLSSDLRKKKINASTGGWKFQDFTMPKLKTSTEQFRSVEKKPAGHRKLNSSKNVSAKQLPNYFVK